MPVLWLVKVAERQISRNPISPKNLAPPNVGTNNIERLTPKLFRAVWRLIENFNTSL